MLSGSAGFSPPESDDGAPPPPPKRFGLFGSKGQTPWYSRSSRYFGCVVVMSCENTSSTPSSSDGSDGSGSSHPN